MRRALLLLAACAISSSLASESLKVAVEARTAILMNADTGAILFSKEAEAEHYPASTTKIATALCILEKYGDRLDTMTVASQTAVGAVSTEDKKRSNYQIPAYTLEFGGTHMGIKRSEELSVGDLLRGLMICSANDAANVLAETVSETIPAFVAEMNERLWELGCSRTFFANPHGLHHPEHVTCALDLAIMTREALKNPLFREMASSRFFERPDTNKQAATVLAQTNRLVRPGKHYYPYAIGVKTGQTSMARANLVAAADDGERTLIAVLLDCEERSQVFEDAIALFEAAYGEDEVQARAVQEGPQEYTLEIEGAACPVKTYAKHPVYVSYYPADPPVLRGSVVWDTLQLPVEEDQHVGEIHVIDARGDLVGLAPLYAQQRVGRRLPAKPLLLGAGIGGVLLLAAYLLRRR